MRSSTPRKPRPTRRTGGKNCGCGATVFEETAAIKKRLAALADRVETLWGFTLRRLTIAESEIRRDIDIWGQHPVERSEAAVTREQIEAVLHNEDGAYRRLRRVMDAWCALWSWPLTTDVAPPDWDHWIGGLEAILGVPPKAGRFEKYGQISLAHQLDWDELDAAEDNDRIFSRRPCRCRGRSADSPG